MTQLGAAILTLGAVSAVSGVVAMMTIAGSVAARGVPVNYVFIRFFIFRYISQYRALTIEETGRVGPFFYWFVISMNLALVCAIAGLVLMAG